MRALAELRRSHPAARLDIVAHGPQEEETAALVRALGLGDVVKLLGNGTTSPSISARSASC